MSAQITFRPGQPITFVATRTFDLGNTQIKIVGGMEVHFDGTTVSIPGHASHVMPQLRAAVKTGWLVLPDNYDPYARQRPMSANMQMRPAEGGNPMQPKPRQSVDTSHVEREEREVQNVRAHANSTAQRNAQNYRREGGESVRTRNGFEVIEDQEGVAVRTLKTPAKQATNLERTNPYSAIQAANSVAIDPGEGRSREEMMATMTEEQRLSYEMDRAAHIATKDPEAAAQIVARVAAPGIQQREGFQITGSVGNGVEIADMGGTGAAGPAQLTTIESEGMVFRNTNGPKKNVRVVPTNGTNTASNGVDAMARTIARSICPDFPENYVFSDPIRKKIARLQADFEDRPDVIRAVAAADTDQQLRQRLFEEFPQAFGG